MADNEPAQENQRSELTERINKFLFEEDLLDDAKVDKYLVRVVDETGVKKATVKKVIESVLGILEGVKTDKGVVEGEAFGAHIVRRRGLRRRFWGGNTIDFR